jgi:hypothetical protein
MIGPALPTSNKIVFLATTHFALIVVPTSLKTANTELLLAFLIVTRDEIVRFVQDRLQVCTC